jgi:hypothetical protein
MSKVWIPDQYNNDGNLEIPGHFEGEDDAPAPEPNPTPAPEPAPETPAAPTPGTGFGDEPTPSAPTPAAPAPADLTGGWTTDEMGNRYKINDNGIVTFKGANNVDYSWNEAKHAFTDSTGKIAGDQGIFLDMAKKIFVKPDGTLNTHAIGVIGGGLLGAVKAFQPDIKKVGYQGGLPNLVAQRTMVTAPPAGYVPGSGGINYGGNVQYSDPAAHLAAPAAPVQNPAASAPAPVNPYIGKMHRDFATAGSAESATAAPTPAPANSVMTPAQLLEAQAAARNQTIKAAQGGIMGLAHGGRYLQGNTDGMADKLRTSIDGKQPAALSHGEFVVPADVVSHLGNGNSDAGAQKLYQMMDKIREARTGTKKQGKQINPDKFMPGGLARLAQGGAVSHFVTGGPADLTNVPSGTTGVEQTTAGYTGNYIPNMLAQTQALTSAPYQQYTGQLTAGPSDLQNQAFAGASENAMAGYNPTQFTSGTFDSQAAQQYMNPYLQAALDPQIAEARRQSDITAQQNNAQMTRAGAFGGSRQAILSAENQRNLGTNLADITGKGYNTAFTNAQAQYNADQNRNLTAQENTEKSRQYGADYGIKSLNQLNDFGTQERGITSEGLAADKKLFEENREAPYKNLKFSSEMLNGLPITATNYSTAQPNSTQQILAGAGGLTALLGDKTSFTKDDVTALMTRLGLTP